MDAQVDISQFDAELAARDAELAARDAELLASAARIAELEEQVAKLTALVVELQEKLSQDSTNSNLPPSSDGPGKNAAKQKRRKQRDKGRKRGGQPGHRGSSRSLLPPEKVARFVDLYPSECESCWAPLPKVEDPGSKRYQFTELEPLVPRTTEYRRHGVVCPHCGYRTMAAYDEEVIPRFSFGPRLMAVVAMLTGVYHLSRRKTVRLLRELLGLRISLGSVSNIEKRVADAVEPSVDEAWTAAVRAKVKHTDGTSWLQTGVLLSLWTIATTAVTVFKIVADGRMETLRKLFFKPRGVLVSDRATTLTFWAMEQRQICWAHLLRKFVSFSERDGPAGTIGKELLEYTGLIFEYWADFNDGKLSREQLRQWMAPVRKLFEATLERAVVADIKGFSGSCADMLKHRLALWTFVDREDVEPTNNHAEQELRAFVLWRRRSFGTQSERGNRFAERVMTVVHTARKQNKDVLSFLSACCEAQVDQRPAPSLFAPGYAAA